MKVLLDTNIIIHRESHRILNKSIGQLFNLLDKGKFDKCVHPITLQEIEKNSNLDTAETFSIKLESYEQLQTVTPLRDEVKTVSDEHDTTDNDKNDTLLLNEIFAERIDYLITQDRKIHSKAKLLDIDDRVFTISSFIGKVLDENPGLVEYKVLAVKQRKFGDIEVTDPFFDSFREDYCEFNKWYLKKSDEPVYVTLEDGVVTSFLYLKVENEGDESYSDITPQFLPKKRLKIGTFKITSTGNRLSERFMKVVFDNALRNKVKEIYVTIFISEEDIERKMLVRILEDWGFEYHGIKVTENGEEVVYKRNYNPNFNIDEPKITYPYMSQNNSIFLVPIKPEYHSDLLPDSLLNNERPEEYIEESPHRNAIKKVYISRSYERDIKKGDLIIFYRTGGYYKSVITTLGIVESTVFSFKNSKNFITKCRKRSVFTDEKLLEWWNENPNNPPFIVNFLYCYTLPKRINLKKMIDLGIIADVNSAPRGFTKISKEHFETILRETNTNESIIVD
ncbi:MAG: hypothetical protein PF638_14855 [Candidatus Delongbacteria bacterium]|jgi:predicted nucleic acid-binding protein|nr:hypothetical protein [Candidatus Delongbacteria bacterium]